MFFRCCSLASGLPNGQLDEVTAAYFSSDG